MPEPSESRKEMRAAIEAFEQILEVMPRDRGALEAILLAVQEDGDAGKTMEYRMRLVEVLLEEQDEAAARQHIDLLRSADNERARALVAQFEQRHPATPAGSTGTSAIRAPTPRKTPLGRTSSSFNMAEELGVAWKLLEAGELSQEEYASLARDLTEMSSTDVVGTISTLHALESGNFKQFERMLAVIARESRAPFITLSCFAMRAELAPLLPWDFMLHRGALVFEQLGKEHLVAVLNPFSQSLREDLQTLLKSPCHLFLARPSEFDAALARLSENLVAHEKVESVE